jgi:hypothetical protein
MASHKAPARKKYDSPRLHSYGDIRMLTTANHNTNTTGDHTTLKTV